MPSLGVLQKMSRNSFALFGALIATSILWLWCADSFAEGMVRTGNPSSMLAADLPKQGQEALALIRKGGPFPYAKDGVVFGNRERLLPKQTRGYYREFTVKTPGSRDRGARRIVCGGDLRNRAASDCFYTDDHYASFKRIKE